MHYCQTASGHRHVGPGFCTDTSSFVHNLFCVIWKFQTRLQNPVSKDMCVLHQPSQNYCTSFSFVKLPREIGFSSGCAFCSKFLCSYSHSTMQVLRTVNPNRFFESQHHGEKGEPISQRLGITAVLINHQLLAIELLIHALLGVLHRLSVHHFDQPSSPPLP